MFLSPHCFVYHWSANLDLKSVMCCLLEHAGTPNPLMLTFLHSDSACTMCLGNMWIKMLAVVGTETEGEWILLIDPLPNLFLSLSFSVPMDSISPPPSPSTVDHSFLVLSQSSKPR